MSNYMTTYYQQARKKNVGIRERLRQLFPTGCRVELVRMDDPAAPPIGTHGTVIGVDAIANILVDWDNGSGLNIVYGEDICRRLDKEADNGR